jgi:TPR repeat protein
MKHRHLWILALISLIFEHAFAASRTDNTPTETSSSDTPLDIDEIASFLTTMPLERRDSLAALLQEFLTAPEYAHAAQTAADTNESMDPIELYIQGVELIQNSADHSKTTEGFELLTQSANQYYSPALHYLGCHYIQQNPDANIWPGNAHNSDSDLSYQTLKTLGVAYLERAAHQNYAPALFALSRYYALVKGAEKNTKKATELLSAAAAQGHVEARSILLQIRK